MVKSYTYFFIRHGKLTLPYRDHSEFPFQIIADLASEKLNPSIDKKYTQTLIRQISKIIPLSDIKKIYSSPSKRCQETAFLVADFIDQNFKKQVKVITIPGLKEIRFDFNKIYQASGSSHVDIEKINDSVFLAMLNNKDCEPISEVYRRVGHIFNKMPKTEICLFITHDFLMRVVEIYIKNKGKINSLIKYEDFKKTKRNLYLHGFATNHSLSTLVYF